jgi:hypothetical protein
MVIFLELIHHTSFRAMMMLRAIRILVLVNLVPKHFDVIWFQLDKSVLNIFHLVQICVLSSN